MSSDTLTLTFIKCIINMSITKNRKSMMKEGGQLDERRCSTAKEGGQLDERLWSPMKRGGVR